MSHLSIYAGMPADALPQPTTGTTSITATPTSTIQQPLKTTHVTQQPALQNNSRAVGALINNSIAAAHALSKHTQLKQETTQAQLKEATAANNNNNNKALAYKDTNIGKPVAPAKKKDKRSNQRGITRDADAAGLMMSRVPACLPVPRGLGGGIVRVYNNDGQLLAVDTAQVLQMRLHMNNNFGPLYYRNDRRNLQCFPFCTKFADYKEHSEHVADTKAVQAYCRPPLMVTVAGTSGIPVSRMFVRGFIREVTSGQSEPSTTDTPFGTARQSLYFSTGGGGGIGYGKGYMGHGVSEGDDGTGSDGPNDPNDVTDIPKRVRVSRVLDKITDENADVCVGKLGLPFAVGDVIDGSRPEVKEFFQSKFCNEAVPTRYDDSTGSVAFGFKQGSWKYGHKLPKTKLGIRTTRFVFQTILFVAIQASSKPTGVVRGSALAVGGGEIDPLSKKARLAHGANNQNDPIFVQDARFASSNRHGGELDEFEHVVVDIQSSTPFRIVNTRVLGRSGWNAASSSSDSTPGGSVDTQLQAAQHHQQQLHQASLMGPSHPYYHHLQHQQHYAHLPNPYGHPGQYPYHTYPPYHPHHYPQPSLSYAFPSQQQYGRARPSHPHSSSAHPPPSQSPYMNTPSFGHQFPPHMGYPMPGAPGASGRPPHPSRSMCMGSSTGGMPWAPPSQYPMDGMSGPMQMRSWPQDPGHTEDPTQAHVHQARAHARIQAQMRADAHAYAHAQTHARLNAEQLQQHAGMITEAAEAAAAVATGSATSSPPGSAQEPPYKQQKQQAMHAAMERAEGRTNAAGRVQRSSSVASQSSSGSHTSPMLRGVGHRHSRPMWQPPGTLPLSAGSRYGRMPVHYHAGGSSAAAAAAAAAAAWQTGSTMPGTIHRTSSPPLSTIQQQLSANRRRRREMAEGTYSPSTFAAATETEVEADVDTTATKEEEEGEDA